MGKLITVLCSSAVLFTAAAASADNAGKYEAFLERTLEFEGIARSYYVHLPNNTMPSSPLPVLFVLHGGDGANAETMAAGTGYNKISDKEAFIVVYPYGVDGQWNDGRGKTFRKRSFSGADDTGFISAAIDRIAGEFPVDINRIYVMGASNGGMMTLRLGIELGDRIAAIAAVIANLPVNLASTRPARPLPVLIMNGTKDPLIPWEGGILKVYGRDFGELLSTEETVAFWVRANGLTGEPDTEILPDKVARDRCTVEIKTYGQEGENPPVVLYAIHGGGHNLPGGRTLLRYFLLGNKCMDINGAEAIWNFLKQFSLN
ncbi:MAG: esterase [Candidatus Omnitrophica bacterium]|nr:esterase [Candidatus Omnitrophota bacterium]